MDIEFCAPFQTSLDVVEIENRLPSLKFRFSASCVMSAEFSRCDCRRGVAADLSDQQAVPGRHGARRALPDRHRSQFIGSHTVVAGTQQLEARGGGGFLTVSLMLKECLRPTMPGK